MSTEKVVIFGANGFIGTYVAELLAGEGHEVVGVVRDQADGPGPVVDLDDVYEVGELLESAKPDVIINCAGVVRNDPSAEANVRFTGNILLQVVERQLQPRRIVVLGSAAEYGIVGPDQLPVPETAPVGGSMPYALSKVQEVQLALDYRESHGLPVVAGRVNPIGPGMPERLLVPRMLAQIEEVRRGERQALEISRLDAERDYIDVRDLAQALAKLALGDPQHAVYNIGSGVATSNGQLIDALLKHSGLAERPQIIETADVPEPTFASQADISRLREEFGWRPAHKLDTTIKEIVDAAKD